MRVSIRWWKRHIEKLEEETRGGKETVGTHIELDTEILKVERALPDVNANAGDVREKHVLVGSDSNLKAFRVGPRALIHEWLVEGRGIIFALTHEPAPGAALDVQASEGGGNGPSYSMPSQPLPSRRWRKFPPED